MTNEEFIESISFENEIWKYIPMFENYYKSSNFGRVVSLKRTSKYKLRTQIIPEPRLLKNKRRSDGYEEINLKKGDVNKYLPIHRLVATIFISNPESKPFVDHINGIKHDNVVSNLRWVTAPENMQNQHFKLSKEERIENYLKIGEHQPSTIIVCMKDKEVVKIYNRVKDATKDGFRQYSVSNILNHRHKTTKGGFTFMYLSEYQEYLNSKYTNLFPVN